MHTPNLRRLQASFEWFRPCGPALIAHAIRTASDRNDDLRSIVPDDTSHLTALLFRALSELVARSSGFAKIEQPLAVLGQRAALAGVRASQLPVIRDALLDSMAQLAGGDWSPELHSDWESLLDGAIGVMMAGSLVSRRAA
jgi:hypothetical protein